MTTADPPKAAVCKPPIEMQGLRRWRLIGVAGLVTLLAACASGPKSSNRDGPEARPPPDLGSVPDAEPKVEPIREGGPNKPYEVLGRDYTPLKEDKPLTEKGLASWYGRKFQGRRTASGEIYNMYAMTAAHKTMPIPSYARVRNPANGREIIVRVNDRGPFHAGRVIDLSYTAALKLGVLNGVAPVEIERITHEQIRTGSWRRDGAVPSPAEPVPESYASKAMPAPAAPVAPDVTIAAVPLPGAVVAVTDAPAALSTSSSNANAQVAVNLPATPVATNASTAPALAVAPTADAAPARAFTTAAQGFWVQLGAFRQRDGAEQFQRKVSDELSWLSPLLAVFSEPSMFRLQAGPYPSRSEALDAAGRVREALKLVPVIVERR